MVALALLTYVNLVGVLLASRMAFDAYGSTDLFAIGRIFVLAVVLAYLLGGFSNFFLRRPFVSDAVFGLVAMVTVAFVINQFFQQAGQAAGICHGRGLAAGAGGGADFVRAVDSGGAGAGLLDAAGHDPDPGDLLGAFLLGIMSDYLFWPAGEGRLVVGFRALHA